VKNKVIFLAGIAAIALILCGESLWKDSGDLYSSRSLKPGDPVKVVFQGKKLVEFSTFQENYESASLNNPDKSATMVLNFLPSLSGDNANKSSKKAQTKNAQNLNFTIMATVQSVDSNGNLTISGQHRMTINNQTETAQVTGIVNPRYLRGDKVWSEDVAELSVAYDRTVYKKDMITPADLENQATGTNMKLTDPKKQELMLKYFNQVLPLLFQ